MGWIIALIAVAVLGAGGWIGISRVFREHKEIRALPLNRVDFSDLKDGVYTGAYEGGMYKWRQNSVRVTVSDGKVSDIEQLGIGFTYNEPDKLKALYDRVIREQSLEVDVISGATLTSKGFLQAVENALLQAK